MTEFRSADDRAYMSPSSSPASSASPEPIAWTDSSPPSTPPPQHVQFDNATYSPPGPPHPFAGSTNSNRPPPRYEMNPDSPYTPRTPPHSPPARAAAARKPPTSPTPVRRVLFNTELETREEREARLWKKTISEAIDGADPVIDLSANGLTTIPSEISDLANLVIVHPPRTEPKPIPIITPRQPTLRTFSRVQTAPAAVFGSPSSSTETIPKQRGLELYLGKNQISELPREFFNLRNLTVLVLRNNALTHIPPQIAELRTLRHLNVAVNQLRHLPAELNSLHLSECYVTPNPLLEPPPVQAPATSQPAATPALDPTTPIHIGPISRSPDRIPPLTELALRCLVSPAPIAPDTNLSAHYALPLPHSLPPGAAEALASCFPGRAARDAQAPTHRVGCELGAWGAARRRGIEGCGTASGSGHGGGAPFVQHMEERVVWVSRLAGVNIGAPVPLLWRGCGVGCLDFLEDGQVQEDPAQVEVEGASDFEEQWVPQQVQLGTVLEGEDDEDWAMGE
ncbi:hypothetical protein EVG20_g3959 [Dentipellis fragilis]|uniref:Uncharacterized protein n=1 Tax=Dentipellis fragilis TaxID=205917 RepID=A0A4Y9Z064_9AGAM|nr:hypothetical protein EVG20_g3959 [Dentipellis fragilis]